MTRTVKRLILASASVTRQRLLKSAGIAFECVTAQVDEEAVRAALELAGDTSPEDVAELLARAKAQEVLARHPDCVVIGADQILAQAGRIYSKPGGPAQARDHLLELRGKTHQLHSAVVVAEGKVEAWCVVETAHLTMRNLSPELIGAYLSRAGEDVRRSVGAYQLESLGVHLFERIDGDYFTILGLPLLPLLGELRRRGLAQL